MFYGWALVATIAMLNLVLADAIRAVAEDIVSCRCQPHQQITSSRNDFEMAVTGPSHHYFSPMQCKGFICHYGRHIMCEIRGGGNKQQANPSSTRAKAPENNNKTYSAAKEGWKNSLASGLASCCVKTLLQPIDTIKTIQQHAQGEKALDAMECIQMVLNRPGGGGWKDLYAGLAVSALGSVPSISLCYGIYSYSKRILLRRLTVEPGSQQFHMQSSNPRLKLLVVAFSSAIG